LSAATIAALFFAPAYAAEPVSIITAIDARSGLVTLRDSTTGQVAQVKVNNLVALKDLKVGQQAAVGAAYPMLSRQGNLTLTVHGAEPVSVTVQADAQPAPNR
jgi:hypothetical protein